MRSPDRMRRVVFTAADGLPRVETRGAGRGGQRILSEPFVGADASQLRFDDAREFAERVGYPVLIKASAGGGGKGMREVHDPADLESHYKAARAEAAAAFGNDGVYLEKLVLRPRHVEVQVLADNHGNNVALCERDCSVQRRHQKIIEEGPPSVVSEEVWTEMQLAAVRLAQLVHYTNVGTVEYLYMEDGTYSFLELNPRWAPCASCDT